MFRKDNILSRQNPILKLIICIVLVLISSIINFDTFLILFIFTFLYMIVLPKIYLIWFKTIIKIIPFFISLFIFGIIFNLSFPDQCFLSARILHILLISVYLVETSSIDSFIAQNKNKKSEFWFKCKFFLAATVHFIPILISRFNDNRKIYKNIIDIIVLSMEECVKEIHHVEIAVINQVRIDNGDKKISLRSDLYLLLLLIIPTFFVIIKNY